MSLRKLRLESALSRVIQLTKLRRPQREALEQVHQFFSYLDRDLPEMTRQEFLEVGRELYPHFVYGGDFPEMTFALATGVGKTRLMGAIMSYLFLSRQSRNFLLLAPRSAILRKLEAECVPSHPKYIFSDSALIPSPQLCHSANLDSFRPDDNSDASWNVGPSVFVFSPQSFAGEERRVSRRSEFSGTSLHNVLQTTGDLIVLADESHHFGKTQESETQAWTQAVRDLNPRMQLGMTATPREGEGANVAYRYDLRTCLSERLYTKDVRLVVRQRADSNDVSDEDWDRQVIEFALDRLERKEQAIAEYDGPVRFPRIQPVLLVCAESTAHAESVAKWLQDKRALSPDEIIVTHSARTKREEDIERLVNIAGPDSRVRVVVNVFELTEGWDVTNVYVIAPLRKMGSFQGAVQTMGRGLRLPADRRVEDQELDTLDVLCFGRESLREILDSAIEDFGNPEDKGGLLDVTDSDDEDLHREPRTKTVEIASQTPRVLNIPDVEREPQEPDLEFDASYIRRVAKENAVEFRLGSTGVSATDEAVTFERSVFVRLAAGRVLNDLKYLSEPLHRKKVELLVEQFLSGLGLAQADVISLDWAQVAEAIKSAIDGPYRKKGIVYRVGPQARRVEFGAFTWRVPERFSVPIDRKSISKWDKVLFRIPISGWVRGAADAVAFDSGPEFQVAEVIDRSADVEWWVRNDPARLRISTPIGAYHPDLIVLRSSSGEKRVTIIEVKMGNLWTPEDSNPRVKARAADAWCEAVNAGEKGVSWDHLVILDVDCASAQTIGDLDRLRVNDI